MAYIKLRGCDHYTTRDEQIFETGKYDPKRFWCPRCNKWRKLYIDNWKRKQPQQETLF